MPGRREIITAENFAASVRILKPAALMRQKTLRHLKRTTSFLIESNKADIYSQALQIRLSRVRCIRGKEVVSVWHRDDPRKASCSPSEEEFADQTAGHQAHYIN